MQSEEKLSRVPVPNEPLESLVNAYEKNGIIQKNPEWYRFMGVTVGGSEVAAIMGLSPYSNFKKVVESKVSILLGINKRTSSSSCRWGTLFEQVLLRVVEADLGSRIYGNDLCVQIRPGFRCSPDGLCLGKFFGNELISFTEHGHLQDQKNIEEKIVLLEMKCPTSRQPSGQIPPHYIPQVQTGLVAFPFAQLGIFVDANFKKCKISDLGEGARYDSNYHQGPAPSSQPRAWGVIGVYAPEDSLQYVRGKKDLGESNAESFNKFLYLIDTGYFSISQTRPRFYRETEERRPPVEALLSEAIHSLEASAPSGHHLWGLLPWKLFELYYIPIQRDEMFFESIWPTIKEVHDTVAITVEEVRDLVKRQKENRPYLAGCLSVVTPQIQDIFDIA